MAVGIQVLKIFIELQQRDLALDMLKKSRRGADPEIARVKKDLLAKHDGLDSQRESHKKLLTRRRELERALQEKEAEIKKHQGELNQVKTNDAFRALQTEITALKAQADEAETAILFSMDEAQAAVAAEKQLADAFAKEEAAAAAAITKLNEKVIAFEEQIAVAQHARNNLLAGLCADELLAKYDYLRANREGLAICSVKTAPAGIICLGCNMRIPPHISMDLKKPGAVVCCDNCQRMLYTSETLGTHEDLR